VETPVRPSLAPRNTFEKIKDMAINVLSLPTDIPWRRLAISRDMYATSLAATLPTKWRSSLAVFYYDPVPDPETSNPDEISR
jgi:hypothetical protein